MLSKEAETEAIYFAKKQFELSNCTEDDIQYIKGVFLAGYTARDEEDRWVSVHDRLPAAGELVLAYGIGTRPSMCQFNKGLFERYVDVTDRDRILVIYYDQITHWQPLPSKPINRY